MSTEAHFELSDNGDKTRCFKQIAEESISPALFKPLIDFNWPFNNTSSSSSLSNRTKLTDESSDWSNLVSSRAYDNQVPLLCPLPTRPCPPLRPLPTCSVDKTSFPQAFSPQRTKIPNKRKSPPSVCQGRDTKFDSLINPTSNILLPEL